MPVQKQKPQEKIKQKIKQKIKLELPDKEVKIRDYITKQKKLSYEELLWIFRKPVSRRTELDNLRLVQSNLALVYSIAKKSLENHKTYNNMEISFIDLFNAGILGLNISIQKFDSTKQTKFSTYAYSWIKLKIREEIRSILYPLKTYSYAPITIQRDVKKSSSSSSFDFDNENENQNKNQNENKNESNSELLNYNMLISDIKSALTKNEYELFILYFLEKQTMNDIAKKRSKSISTIQYHLDKLKLKLRELLGGKNGR